MAGDYSTGDRRVEQPPGVLRGQARRTSRLCCHGRPGFPENDGDELRRPARRRDPLPERLLTFRVQQHEPSFRRTEPPPGLRPRHLSVVDLARQVALTSIPAPGYALPPVGWHAFPAAPAARPAASEAAPLASQPSELRRRIPGRTSPLVLQCRAGHLPDACVIQHRLVVDGQDAVRGQQAVTRS